MTNTDSQTRTTQTTGTRAEIKRVFSAHLAKAGYDGLSLEAVARDVGIRKPSIYHHFPGGKETLLAEVTRDHVEDQGTRLSEALTANGSLQDRLVQVVITTADPSGFTTSFGQRIFEALGAVDSDTRAELSALYVARLLAPVQSVFENAIRKGELAAGNDPELLMNAFLHMARAIDLTPDHIEPTAGALVRLFLDGARSR